MNQNGGQHIPPPILTGCGIHSNLVPIGTRYARSESHLPPFPPSLWFRFVPTAVDHGKMYLLTLLIDVCGRIVITLPVNANLTRKFKACRTVHCECHFVGQPFLR